jgi:hypothetical protein
MNKKRRGLQRSGLKRVDEAGIAMQQRRLCAKLNAFAGLIAVSFDTWLQRVSVSRNRASDGLRAA